MATATGPPVRRSRWPRWSPRFRRRCPVLLVGGTSGPSPDRRHHLPLFIPLSARLSRWPPPPVSGLSAPSLTAVVAATVLAWTGLYIP